MLGKRFRRSVFVALAAVMAASGGLADATAAVSITSVNGAPPPAGGVTTSGASVTLGGEAALPPPLIVDAGDSAAVARGGSVPVNGLVAGATGPVTFAWSAPSGTFADPAAAATTYTAAAAAPAGPVVLTLTATDGHTGDVVADTVKFLVYDPTVPTEAVRVRQTLQEGLPEETFGPTGRVDRNSVEVPFFVPAGSSDLVIDLTWGSANNEVSDLDLRLVGPGGAYAELTDGASSTEPCNPNLAEACAPPTEQITVTAPLAGDYRAVVEGYLSTDEAFTLVASYRGAPQGVLPVIDVPGPFTFDANAVQAVRSTVTGGRTPTAVRWDLDGDGIFETPGASALTHKPLGAHLVTAKVTDNRGYEHRETTAVRVLAVGSELETPPFVVIAVNDSGINPYHEEFGASLYPDPRVLAATDNFTKHPSEYLPGYPASSERIDITLGQGYRPAADDAVWTRENIPLNQLVWFPGTKVIGAVDSDDAGAINGAADATPILDDDGHGTHSASVALGNVTGFCPSCLLMFAEGFRSTLPYDATWVDFVSNSWSSNAAADVLSTAIGDPVVGRAPVERGQTVLFAAGNGNEGNFVTPNNTYATSTTGPDWIVRVGAANSVTGKPILGDGNPVDVTSYGDGPIPSADHLSATGYANHSGTSSATPYTAGVMGSVLAGMRSKVGDGAAGQRPGGVLAQGARTSRGAMTDGKLTRLELWEAVMKTAAHNTSAAYQAGFATVPDNPRQYVFEGYGLVNPTTATAALEVLDGRRPLPRRDAEDEFLAADSGLRLHLYGEWAGAKPAVQYGTGKATPWAYRADPLRYATTDPTELLETDQAHLVLDDVTDAFDQPSAAGAAGPNMTNLTVSSPSQGAKVDLRRQPAIPVTGRVGSNTASKKLFLRRTACGTGEVLSLSPQDDTDASPDADCTNLAHSLTATSIAYDLFTDEFPMQSGLGSFRLAKDRPIKVSLWVDSLFPNTSVVIDARLSDGATIVGEQRLTKVNLQANKQYLYSFSFLPRITDERELADLKLLVTLQRADFPVTTWLSGPSSFMELPLAPLDRGEVEISVDDPTFAGATTRVTVSADNTWGTNLATDGLTPGNHTLYVRRLWGPTRAPLGGTAAVNVVLGDGGIFTGVEVGAALGTQDATTWVAADQFSSGTGGSVWSGTVVLPGGPGTSNNVRARLVVDGVIVGYATPIIVHRT